MKSLHRSHCRSTQREIPTINRKKIRHRYSKRRPAAATRYNTRKESDNKLRSKRPSALPVAGSFPKLPGPEKCSTARQLSRSHRERRKVEARRRGLVFSSAPDHLRVTSCAQIGLGRRSNRNAKTV